MGTHPLGPVMVEGPHGRVPLSEVANGVVKWLTRRGRPAWVDERVMMHQWSSEFSFPSSHSQLAAAVMTWLVLSSAHAEAATSTPALPSAAASRALPLLQRLYQI